MPTWDPDRDNPDGDMRRDPPPNLVDPVTGEIKDPAGLEKWVGGEALPPAPVLASLRTIGQARAHGAFPRLDTLEAVVQELNRELRKLEIVGQHIIDARQHLDGYYTDAGDYVAGVNFEYQEAANKFVRKLYAQVNDQLVPKDKRPKWPGEDVREALAEEEIDVELRQKRQALKSEIDALREYRMLTQSRANGLQSILGYRRDQAKIDAYNPTNR